MNQKDDLEWFGDFFKTPQFAQYKERPVAYFCAEYALEGELPTYAGGLGILAGDIVREARDRNFPLVAVGLYYHEGYVAGPDEKPYSQLGDNSVHPGLQPVVTAQGTRAVVRVPIQDRIIAVQAWQINFGSVTIYFLDTDVESNSIADRAISNRLYVGDKEARLKQECVLGIGGLRLLQALDIHPSIYHLNEGHSAMLTLELVKHEMEERKIGFEEAKQFARRRVVFTNHTLVAAGHEVYNSDLVSLMLSGYATELGIPVESLVETGEVPESSTYSMTTLSLRMAGVANAVSRLQAKKASKIWPEHPLVAVTNGIHVSTWDKIGTTTQADEMWRAHRRCKSELLKELNERTGVNWQIDELLLGWARRIVQYKRPLAIIEDIQRFSALARNTERPVRLLFSGRPHSSDETGQRIFRDLKDLSGGILSGVAVFVPEYDLALAQKIVSGCDILVNTPIVGFEACGTSGMKGALNGTLALTTKDGWFDEVDISELGWEITEPAGKNMLDLLEDKILPTYYTRNSAGVPEKWLEMMRQARSIILNRFSATRMLREYIELLYV